LEVIVNTAKFSLRRLILPLAGLCVALIACGEDNPTGGNVAPLSGDAVVNYSATRTGDATVTSITYRDETGAEVTEPNPSLPWFKSFSAPSGTQISQAAQITVNTSGSVQIVMRAGGNGANVNERASRSAAKPVSFELTLPAVTLP
jgi:hypothetical protein